MATFAPRLCTYELLFSIKTKDKDSELGATTVNNHYGHNLVDCEKILHHTYLINTED